MKRSGLVVPLLLCLSVVVVVSVLRVSPARVVLEQEIAPQDDAILFPHEQLGDSPGERPPQSTPRTKAAPVLRGGFVSYQVNVDANGNNITGDAGNEPSLCVDPTDPSRIAVGWRQFDTITSNFRTAGNAYSTDVGKSWTNNTVLTPGTFRSDPVLAADPDGTFYYYSLKGDFSCDTFQSVDGGQTWTGPVAALGGDKAWFIVDRTSGAGAGNLYIDWSLFAGCCGSDTFTRSTDGGSTYDTPQASPGDIVWGTLDTDSNGRLYVCGRSPNNSSELYVAMSPNAADPIQTPVFTQIVEVDLDGGLRFSEGPNPGGLLGQMWVAVDRSGGANDGNVYALASVNPPGSDPLDVHFSRSTDGGLTWSAPIRINDDATDNGAYQWFGTMSVAPNGRIDVVWNDTRNDPSVTFSETYYSYSNDGGVTWSASVAFTPAFNHFLGYPNQSKLGDYYHSISDNAAMNLAYAATFNGEQDVYFTRLGDANENGVHDSVEMVLAGPSPGTVDTVNTLTVSGAEPGASIEFAVGKQDGFTDVEGCDGLRFNMKNARVLRTRTADGSGNVSVSGFIGSGKSGKTFYFQVHDPASCNLSNVIEYTFP